MKKTLLKVLNIAVTVLIVMILIISIFVVVLTLTSKDESDGVPNFFGKSPINVLTDSMKGKGELNFDKGDLLICDAITTENRIGAKYKKGDVVTFKYDINKDGFNDFITHRIYKVNKDGSYLTKGDNNDTYDQNPKATTIFPNISSNDIVATYHGARIKGLGNFMDYLRSQTGFFFVILLPMIIFFLYTAVRVVLNAMAYSKEKGMLKAQEAIANADLTEEQKAKAIAEYLASVGEKPAEGESSAQSAPENAAEKDDAEKENPDAQQ